MRFEFNPVVNIKFRDRLECDAMNSEPAACIFRVGVICFVEDVCLLITELSRTVCVSFKLRVPFRLYLQTLRFSVSHCIPLCTYAQMHTNGNINTA